MTGDDPDKICQRHDSACQLAPFYVGAVGNLPQTSALPSGAPAGFKNVNDAQPVESGASLREIIRNIDNYFAIG